MDRLLTNYNQIYQWRVIIPHRNYSCNRFPCSLHIANDDDNNHCKSRSNTIIMDAVQYLSYLIYTSTFFHIYLSIYLSIYHHLFSISFLSYLYFILFPYLSIYLLATSFSFWLFFLPFTWFTLSLHFSLPLSLFHIHTCTHTQTHAHTSKLAILLRNFSSFVPHFITSLCLAAFCCYCCS